MPEIIIKLGDQIVQKYYLYKDHISIGRAPENEIAIENLAVSRRHAEISKENGSYVLEDLNSANGTFVNGVQVTRTEIVDKDVISIGKHKLYFYNQQVGSGPMQMVEKTMLVTRPAQTKAMLRVTRGKQKDQVFELSKVENRIGRAADNEIRLGDWFVSKHHAEIVRKGLVFVVRDLASWRHTMVNGQIVDEQVLKPGDEIQFGPKIAMVFEVADGTAAREGSGRKPVELEGADQPLPFAAADHGTPLPIAGSARVSKPALEAFPEGHNAREPEPEYRNGAGGDPQLDEGWDEEFDPEDYVGSEDSDIAAEFEPEEDEGEEDRGEVARHEQAYEPAEAAVAPVRLEDEAMEGVSGWEAAAARAGSAEDSGEVEVRTPRADASDSWSPEAIERARLAEGMDSGRPEPSMEADWLEESDDRIEGVSALQEEFSAPPPSDEEFVETSDSAGLESLAHRDGEAQEQPAVDAAEPTETGGHRGESLGGPVQAEAGSTSAPRGAALVDTIMQACGEDRGLERSEIEMWVVALDNPSRLIRRQAQRKLQKLTGQVYDIES